MPAQTLDEVVAGGLELLPPVGQDVEFEAYKAQLYAAYPDSGRDAFAHMIKRDLVKKELKTVGPRQHVVMLSRKA